MAKVFGPALSIAAKGKIGKGVAFQKRPSGFAMMKNPAPGRHSLDNPSAAQQIQRVAIASLIDQWQALTVNEKKVWDYHALKSGNNLSGYHEFMRLKSVSSTPAGWIRVPGNPDYGTKDFYIMKYEAKNVGGVAVSQADITPWVNIKQTEAIVACQALGVDYHLPTIAEVQTINRNIESVPENWTGGAVGVGMLKRGNVGILDAGSYNGGNPEFGPDRNKKAKLVLTNGEEIWDWSGNVWEWIYGEGANGTIGSGFRSLAGWVEWNIDDLDQERIKLGPSSKLWNAVNNGVGRYYGGVASNAFLRGGYWAYDASAGVFTLALSTSPASTGSYIGFRCVR